VGLSQRAYARRRGVSQEAVRKQVKRGRIPQLPDGTIDAEQAASRARNVSGGVRRW